MTVLHRSRSWLLLWSMSALAVATGAGVGYQAQRRLPEKLRQQALQQGFSVEFGPVQRGLFATTLRNVKLSSNNATGVNATIDVAIVRGALISAPRLAIEHIHFSLNGEPMALYEQCRSISWNGMQVTWRELSVEYAHKVFGNLLLEDLQLDPRDDSTIVRAKRVNVGAARWQDVAFSVHRRNEMLEVGLGDGSVKTALVQLGYFPSTRGASQWTLTATHQPARALGQQLGWDPGPEFDASFAVGSLSFIVPDDPTRRIRGSMQLTFDGWPKPGWADADALLGSTMSLLARIEPEQNMRRWNLPHVEASLSLFSLTGTGRIEFGDRPSVALDLTGTRNCAQMNAHLAASSYLNRVKTFLEQEPATKATAHRAFRLVELVPLRLQLFAEASASGRRNVAWHLEPGCGLPELSKGSFMPLELPTMK
jgi:hypothetical protein